MAYADAVAICLVLEEFVILICRGAIVCLLFEAHLEIGHSHCPSIADIGHLFQFELLWSVGMACRGHVLELGGPHRLADGEI